MTSQGTPHVGDAEGYTPATGAPPPQSTEALRARLQVATLGHYDIYAELGRGGMAVVFLALDLALNRRVAIKVMAPSLLEGGLAVERFRREAQIVGQLAHPNIVPVYGMGVESDIVFFVMRCVEGQSLDRVIRTEGPQPAALVRIVLSQIAGALGYAHHRGVVHRDVKPANVMLDENGFAVVMDFGIAKALDTPGLTSTGTAIGTPYYMSPEQFTGDPIAGTSDQYSLGVVAFELLTGTRPFVGATIPEIMRGHLLDAPPSVLQLRPDCPPELAACVARMLEKDPQKRFPSMDECVVALGSVSAQEQASVAEGITMLARSGPRLPVISQPVSPPVGTLRTKPGASSAPLAATPTNPNGPTGARARVHTGRRWWVGGAVIAAAAIVAVARMALRTPAGSSPSPIPTSSAPPRADSTAAPLRTPIGSATPAPPPVPVATARAEVEQRGKSTPKASAPVAATKAKNATGIAPSGDRTNASHGRPSPETSSRSTQPTDTARPSSATDPNRVRVADSTPVVAPITFPTPAPEPTTASVRIGSHIPTATLYINGRLKGFIEGLQTHALSAGTVHLQIRAEGCASSWDTVFTIKGGAVETIGYRKPPCS